MVEDEAHACGKCEDESYRSRGSNGGEGFIEVSAMALSIAAGCESGFVASNDFILVALDLEDPLSLDRYGTRGHFGSRNGFPCLALV